MKKIVLLTMLLVSTSTFMMAQTPIEQAREKAKALIKGGVTDISKILPKHESDDDEDIDDDDENRKNTSEALMMPDERLMKSRKLHLRKLV